MREKTVNSLDELVQLAVSPHNRGDRYTLHTRKDRVYDDAAAGAAWDEERHNLCYPDGYYGRQGRDGETAEDRAYTAAEKELGERRPAQHLETRYWLEHRYGSWHAEVVNLVSDVGAQVWGVWRKEVKWGNERPVGVLTLAGLVKRLGHVGLDKQIKAAQAAKEARAAKNARNYARRQIAEALKSLDKAIELAQAARIDMPAGTMTLAGVMSALGAVAKAVEE